MLIKVLKLEGFNIRFVRFAVFADTDLYAHHVKLAAMLPPILELLYEGLTNLWQGQYFTGVERESAAMAFPIIVPNISYNWVIST